MASFWQASHENIKITKKYFYPKGAIDSNDFQRMLAIASASCKIGS
jgi:hypothetical protein